MERPGLVYSIILTTILVLGVARAYLEKRKKFEGFFHILGTLELSFIAVLLFTLIFLGCLQIFLRNVLDTGIIWADPMMRHIVLWLGCLGGVMATSRVRHISIDVFTRLLPDRLRKSRDRAIHFVTAIATSLLGFAALKLVVDERDFGEIAFLGVETWVLQAVIPIAFFIISYRSVVNTLMARRERPLEWGDLSDAEGTG